MYESLNELDQQAQDAIDKVYSDRIGDEDETLNRLQALRIYIEELMNEIK